MRSSDSVFARKCVLEIRTSNGATELVQELAGPFDCVFFDADRMSAREQLQILLPKLAPDVLRLADNVLSHPQEIGGYIAEVERLVAVLGKDNQVEYLGYASAGTVSAGTS